jgi:hypothetical protein
MHKYPLRLSIGEGKCVLLFNAVIPFNRSDEGSVNKFSQVFYRNLSDKARLKFLIGPKEVSIGAPLKRFFGDTQVAKHSYALVVNFRPLGFRLEKIEYADFISPIKGMSSKLPRIQVKYEVPGFERTLTSATLKPRLSLVEVNSSIPKFLREEPQIILSARREDIFKIQ